MEMNFRNIAPFIDDAVATQDKNNFSLLSAAKDMAGFVIGAAVLGKISKVGAGAIFKSVEKNNSALAAGITKAVGTELNLGSLFRGVRQVAAEAPETIYKATSAEGKQAMQGLSSLSRASISFGQAGSAIHADLAASSSKVSKLAAYTAKTFYHSAPVAMGYYAITHALGVEGKDEPHPAWYNLPGHVKGMASMVSNFALTDMAMGAIGKYAGGFVKNTAKKYLGKQANPGMHAFMDKHFAITRTSEGGVKAGTFFQTVVRGAAFLDGIRVASKKTNDTVTHTFMQNFGNKTARDAQHSSLFDFTSKHFYKQLKNDAHDAFKSAYKSRMDSLRNYRSDYGHDFVTSMNQMIAKHINVESGKLREQLRSGNFNTLSHAIRTGAGGAHVFGDEAFATTIHKAFEARTLKASKTMGAKILGRQNASVADILTPADKLHAMQMQKYLTHITADHTVGTDHIFENFMKMSAGKNIYKTSGGVVDYSMWQPKNVMNALIGYVAPLTTFNVGFGRELNITKILGLQQIFAKEGIGIHSMRANEGQRYYERGTGSEKGRSRVVGDNVNGNGQRLGGVLVDGELFVMHNDGVLRNANAAKQHMVYTSHHARESVLYKTSADAYNIGDTMKDIGDIERANNKKGMVDKINNFTSRWGLKTPSPVQWAMEGLNKVLGFSPMRKGVNKAIDLLLDPRNTDKSIGGDMSVVLNAFSDMGNKASTKVYNTVSHPKMMSVISRLSKDIGGPAQDRVAQLNKAFSGSDSDLMGHLRKYDSYAVNDELRFALENHEAVGSEGMTDQVGSKFNIRNKPLTKRQDIQRHMLNEVLGMQDLPSTNVDFSAFNIAKKMLSDNEALSMMSKEDVGHLKLVSNMIDLHHHGFLDGSGKVSLSYNQGNIKTEAIDIIRNNFKNEKHLLETNLFDTHMIKEVGVLGFGRSNNDMSPFLDTYARQVRNERREAMQASPFTMMEKGGTANQIGFHVNSLIDRMMDLGNHIGLRYGQEDRKPYNFKIPFMQGSVFGKQFVIGAPSQKGITLGGPLSSMMKRIAQGIGVIAAANAVDTFTSVSPMFHGTILNNGIYSAGADLVVKGSMAYHKLQDITGITEFAKHAEGLMPSSTSTIPGMIIGGMLAGPLGILPGAIANRFASLNGLTPEFDKSYEEKKGEYSGRDLIPVRKNRFWLFSKAPYEGDAPQYYRPSWYARQKSQYKYTDTLYGSKTEAFLYKPWTGLGFNPIGHIIDKYHYEKKHYWDRPYASTSAAFTDVPVFGAILGATIGKLPIIGKPLKYMHLDEMSHYYSMDGSNNGADAGEPSDLAMSKMPTVNQISQYTFMDQKSNTSAKAATYGVVAANKKVNPYGAMTVLGEQLYNFTELAGLRGFQLESIMGGGIADNKPRLSTAGDMWSARRAYWDLGLGDVMGSCFIKGTKVVTSKGRKNIEDINIDEEIITIDGTIKRVVGKLKKEQQNNIYNLKCSILNVNLYVTEKHQFPIYKRYSCHEQNIRSCIPGNRKHCNTCTKKDKVISIIDTPIENIKKGDFVCLPIIQPVDREIIIGGRIINSDIAYFLGWYVAVGCCDKKTNKISLTMNINEIEYAKHLIQIIKSNFGKISHINTRVKDSKLTIRFSDKVLNSDLKLFFGEEVKNKFIPYIIKTLQHELLKQFFRGCVLGGGFSNINTSEFTSTSSDLCRDLFDIGLSLGFLGNLVIDYHEKGKGFMHQGTPRKDNIISYISWKRSNILVYNLLYDKNIPIKQQRKSGNSFVYDNKYFVQVKSNDKINMISDVYDLEIEEKHYYMVEHIVTHNTEFIRRFVPRDKKIWQKINPIRNRFPNWLPSEEAESDNSINFLEGDAFTKIAEGEMRLPGAAYNKLYDVKHVFPSRASSFGNTVADSVREMLGLNTPFDSEADDVTEKGTAMHRYIQDSMLRAGVAVKAEQLVYDTKDDISGHIDLITYDPYVKGGKRVLEIKTVNSNKFNKLKAPIGHHMSQVNFYLRQMHMDVGTLLYVNRDDPSQIRTFDVRYNEERFRKDTKDLQKARQIAAGMVADGKGYETGTSYSWLDRLRILSDVAPYSKEYKDAVEIVKLQIRDNKLTQADIEEVQKIKNRRNSVMRKYDMYPTRFKGRVFSPDTKYELASENTNIKAASEYSLGERVLGSLWESGIQMNTPLNTKLWNYQTPLQHYENTKIYGSESAAWNKPFQDIVHPMMNKALASNDPLGGAANFGWVGAMGFGGMGSMSLPGAIFGAMYGAVRKVVGDDDWIPDEIEKKRSIVKTFDQLKYMKAMNLYNETGEEKWRTEADNTMWSISQKGYKVGMVQTLRALPTAEKPYFLEWLKETNPKEREHILEMVPEDIGNILRANWGMPTTTPDNGGFRNALPTTGYEGFMDNDNLEDIEVKTINREGLRATDFGLGWYDQQRRMSNSQFELNPVTNISQVTVSNDTANKIKSALMRLLGQFCNRPMVAISVSPSGPDNVKLQLNLMRDRHDDMMDVLRAR